MRSIYVAAFLLLSTGCATPEPEPHQIRLTSTIEGLEERFDWAREQALAYAHDGDDPVGLWYEAALPNREAFCMRDVSHQAKGAHFLGLDAHTKNMLRRFAAAIDEKRDWCSFWEINRYDEPAPVDYRNDKEFWYNLPANFDVMNAAWRMYEWTGDKDYVEDPVFLEFYQRTSSDYMVRWDLTPDALLTRERYMNRESFDMNDYYQYARGIPSYHESNQGATQLGVDLLAFQIAGLQSHARVLELKADDSAIELAEMAASTLNLLESTFWNPDDSTYADLLLTDGSLARGGGMITYLLYNDVIDDPKKARATARSLIRFDPGNIEMRSHYPEILYRYGLHGEAFDFITQMTDPATERRTYPEVSFSIVGAIANGLMGISPLADGLQTLSRVHQTGQSVTLHDVPHRDARFSITHEGLQSSTLTLREGSIRTWRASFAGKHEQLWIDGEPRSAETSQDLIGDPVSHVDITLKPGETVTVSIHP